MVSKDLDCSLCYGNFIRNVQSKEMTAYTEREKEKRFVDINEN